MPHNAIKDRIGYAIWVTGSPGVGYNTIGERLHGQTIEGWGYRSTHLKPEEWFICTDVLKYRMTDPTAKNPYYYGFGMNFKGISQLPWKAVCLLVVGESVLADRVISFRKSHNITKDGRTDSEAVQQAILMQEAMMVTLESVCKEKLVELNNEQDPSVVARQVRAVFDGKMKPGEASLCQLREEENGAGSGALGIGKPIMIGSLMKEHGRGT